MAKQKTESVAPEWPHKVTAEDVTKELMTLSISPSESELKNLCNRLEILNINFLRADLNLVREDAMTVHVTGTFEAKVTQNCVVSGEPVESQVTDSFEAWFADPEAASSIAKARHNKLIEKGNVEVPMLEEREDPEAIIDGEIDVGELVTQYLSLAIPAFPHAEGVEYEHGDDNLQKPDGPVSRNPFAALKDWKAKMSQKT